MTTQNKKTPQDKKTQENTVLRLIKSLVARGFTDTVHIYGQSVKDLLNNNLPEVDDSYQLDALFTVAMLKNKMGVSIRPAIGVILRSDNDVAAFLKLTDASRNFIAFFNWPVTRPFVALGSLQISKLTQLRLSVLAEINPSLPIIFERVRNGENVIYNMIQYVLERGTIEEVTVATLRI